MPWDKYFGMVPFWLGRKPYLCKGVEYDDMFFIILKLARAKIPCQFFIFMVE
ncbi:hypothetical protein SELR_15480 [Selenomonas ruminantium subsp. lactilytica TAM6421]|uniref:Uncharacterized protein n=1 Tax=Selenomonas ruminantium subsp. lactilytica (strain NBRC 103574 / TAM6421) TaxID=927704 RepID=I0GR69_SELRL|nr:hypothetical protein SELR_15480 [Selenomonas ruminantium subsp. lactilytica TAM6421]